MLREVQETNELLEHTFEQRVSEKEQIISEVEEKYRLTTKEYENIISGLETKLAKQSTEIEKLRQCVNQQKETECVETVNQVANISLQADNASLKKRIDELTLMLRDEKQRSQSAVETIDELRARCNEFEYVVRNIKEQLNEKSTALEDARAELALSRTEAGSLNINPIADTSKGK
ncbi:hypothetical protein WN55_06403 [Dufourea novaeangliae]|uniref:Uncharacterized protein n=1 Tax=Dufourea novaeangliae TaxID=178035 RepID=A0A154P0S1_DUFNO|nr:hypothetical protein WN55_06403 [Dufourea novaeangliae]